MELTVFDFTDDTLKLLRNIREDLDDSAHSLDDFFFDLLDHSCEGFFNISTRVKSALSLKEKIIRNNYYLKYNSPDDLFNNLSDLIGIRIECRFVDDEKEIYKHLKKVFNLKNNDGLSYCVANPYIFLNLKGEQPLKQKNGFSLYRIDGYILNGDNKFNFELQIKSMVNTFWGEIEHKVIYKNYNMILGNKFYSNILNSIKNNLSMIDNQLLTIYNHINETSENGAFLRKDKLEILLSKMIFDIYSHKLKEEIGISVDFRNACDIIIDYIFSKNNCASPEDYYKTFINMSIRLNEIYKDPISFKSNIIIDDYLDLSSDFSMNIGRKLVKSMNTDFHWNLFFKILFQIEPENNAGDFKNFLKYLETLFSVRDSYLDLYLKFSPEEVEIIKKDILNSVCISFLAVNSIKFMYRDKLQDVYYTIDTHVKFLMENIPNFEYYNSSNALYTDYLILKIAAIFDLEMSLSSIKSIANTVLISDSSLNLSSKGNKFINSLDEDSKVSAKKLLSYFYIK